MFLITIGDGLTTKVVNLTPHTLNIHNADGSVMEVRPSGKVARVEVEYLPTGRLAGLDTFKAVYGQPEGLPAPQEGTVFVVSGMVEAACQDRPDVWSPGNLVRDADGKPCGCQGLKQT